ncbi:MAG: hypothetical protein EA370_10050 [Wenzhouxiangella sp.]|nr:MAG: hypothetical protein EA370_10050 [Wenzhouxiangella sp.]
MVFNFIAAASIFLLAGLCAAASDADKWPVANIDRATAEALSRQPSMDVAPRTAQDWQLTIDQPLLHAWQDHQSGRSRLDGYLSLARELVDGDRLLTEVVYAADSRQWVKSDLRQLGAAITHDISQGNWLEAWLPVHALPDIARLPGVVEVRAARLVQLDGSGTTTEGLAAGQVAPWHDAGLNGFGFTIAVFDRFANNDGQVAALQQSGDWPADSQLDMVKVGMVCGTAFGSCNREHGNAVLEIAYDLAPGANFIAYDVATAADWINATQMATSAGAHIMTASLSSPQDGIGDGSALPGSVAEAKLDAVANGRIVITSGGNSRERHWGGLYSGLDIGDADFEDAHEWTNDVTLNFMANAPGAIFCIPNGTPISAEISWNDWTDVNNDYALGLYRVDGSNEITRVALSDRPQNGGAGQTPQEWITHTTHTDSGWNACPGNDQAGYGWRIYRQSANGNHNFRFFAEAPLEYRVEASSLTYPGDAIGVLSIAAISTDGNQAFLSSEGPILAPGGGVPTGEEHPQPSLATFSPVTTTSISTFGGTSAAAPHAAGMAALLWHRHSSFMFFPAAQIVERLKEIAVTGSNDLGLPGHDFQHGWGRLRFQLESNASFVVQPSDTVIGELMSPNPTIEILDDEGLRIVSGPTREFLLAMGADPGGTGATLQPNLIWPVLDGLVPFGGLNVDAIGEDYTLVATSNNDNFVVETETFKIMPAASLVLGHASGIAGSNITLPFTLATNPINAAALQFDAVLDPDVLELRSGGTACSFIDLVGTTPNLDVSCNDIAANVLRVIALTADLQPIPAGPLFDLRLSIRPEPSPGTESIVALTEAGVSTANADTWAADTLAISHGTVLVNATAQFEATPAQIDFGLLDPASVPAGQTLTLSNTSDQGSAMTIEALALPPSDTAFEIGSENCTNQSLTDGQSCQIEINLITTELGEHSASLLIGTSGASNNTHSVPLSAELLQLDDELFRDRFEDDR